MGPHRPVKRQPRLSGIAYPILVYLFKLRRGCFKRSLGSRKFAIFSTFRIDIFCAPGIIYPVPFGLFSVPAPLFGLFAGSSAGFFISPPYNSDVWGATGGSPQCCPEYFPRKLFAKFPRASWCARLFLTQPQP